jgi:hypothetical protein
MTIGIEKFCTMLRTSRPNVLRIIDASGLEPTVPGRIGRGGMERYSIREAYALAEMVVLREHHYPWALFSHLVKVFYSTIDEPAAISILTDSPLPWPFCDEMAEAENKGVRNVLYPPRVLAEVARRMKPLGRYVKKALATTTSERKKPASGATTEAGPTEPLEQRADEVSDYEVK